MLRHLQTFNGKNHDASLKASVATVRGRLVQKDYANGVAVLPTTQEGLFWIDKGQFPTGLMSLEGELSDYDARFENIAVNDYVVLEKPVTGEYYATTEYVSTGLANGDYLIAEVTVGADQGKLKKNAIATGFKYRGTITDGGKTLAVVEVL